jgi:phosphatidylserine/phosphatidylglycerophosphate/cardiolipin synthase-like enzyme
VSGSNSKALFTLKLHRGDGMTLVAMNWKKGRPPNDFVGFAIEYMEPGGHKFFPLKNRLSFPGQDGSVDPNKYSTRRSPIQKFRWVHFPRNAELDGAFTYKVSPVFMNDQDELSYGEPQQADIELRRETYPGQLNVTFTRGFVLSQAFVDRYGPANTFKTLIPAKADGGLKFKATHPKSKEALEWMGFEARNAILEVLDRAIADKKSEVRVVCYDLNEPGIVSRLVKLKARVKVIIDDSGSHGKAASGESQAAKLLMKSAGAKNVKRQHMKSLQHNKSIVVKGPKVNVAVGGSTNFSWRGFFVQANNALIVQGKDAIKPFWDAFENYWENEKTFGDSPSSNWSKLGLKNIDAQVAFSPHGSKNALLKKIADDIDKTTSSLFFSLAFLYQTEGPIRNSITRISKSDEIFVYGISDKKVGGGLDLKKPDGNVSPVFPAALTKNLPEPFSKEPTGGSGNRMHHKFVVIDFDKPNGRVYLGSYNFSSPADISNGENLFVIRDRRIVVSYMIEAVRLFDHYHFRVAQMEAKKAQKQFALAKPPRKANEKTWFDEDYTNARKVKDRLLFA